MTHPTTAELEAFLPTILDSPDDLGALELIVRRPAVGERETLTQGELDLTSGLVGDSWAQRGSSRTADGAAHPDMQLNVMNSRLVGFLAGDPQRRALAGDQLYLDLDLSIDNLPPGSRLAFGEGEDGGIRPQIEVTEQPHTGAQSSSSGSGPRRWRSSTGAPVDRCGCEDSTRGWPSRGRSAWVIV